jgi:hypothetical protein
VYSGNRNNTICGCVKMRSNVVRDLFALRAQAIGTSREIPVEFERAKIPALCGPVHGAG